jgi:NAD(P)-dependent dehydrogenase (short-subunit alcohol dehydrogenase family)
VLADLQHDLAREVADGLPTAIAVHCDVTKSEDTRLLAAAAIEAFGRVDILINNAGGAMFHHQSFWELSEEHWDLIVDVNLKSAWLCALAMLPAMRQQGRGKIVNIASIAALVGNSGRVAYAASKGGVISLTRAMARELGPFGITVNAVAPGLIEMPHPHVSYTPEVFAQMKESRLAVQQIKRTGQPDDIANAVLFFASRESDFITGQLLPVDGGTAFN